MPETITSSTQVVLFDHDGTLIDSEQTHLQLWQEVMQAHDVTLTEAFYTQTMAGIPVNQNAVDLVHYFQLDVPAETLANAKHAKTRAFLSEQAFPLMPYAIEAVTACIEAGYTVGIVTGGSGLSVTRTLETYDLGKWITTVVAVEDVDNSKPAPDCYLRAASHLNVSPDACVAVEDTQHGMQSALNAGMRCAVIPTPHAATHDFSQATSRYQNLQEWVANELGR
ncbi:HAD family phosphatase [Alteromonas sp. ASW11-19]|uniref:HAD family phosphatase n=1 Tax=Alteromonas salexigens TaxID=2982530 RepID=A0ABT2VIR1_9ALTE|nr:HAD family phosphatase [Alteromonas salexigens]MCU7553032.1 HAD family phosphatase [Alteromonas salexigens]